jgi:hypothetical protein
MPDGPDEISIPLRRFLTIPTCPPAWKRLDLYVIRDEQVTFYAGQSYCAFERVWEHLRGGIKGHAVVGRFILCNWPRSGRFTVEMFHSRAPRFASHAYNVDAIERALIDHYPPRLNVSLTHPPPPIPVDYLPANANIKYLKNFRRMLREAEYAAKVDAEANDTEWK